MAFYADEVRSRIEPLFRENFEKFDELGASISIWQNGRALLDLSGGFRDASREKRWANDTLVLIWSATKGLASACLLHALQENKREIGERVSEFWPKFAQGGKGEITLAQLLSHQAGLATLDRAVDIREYDSIIEAIEQQTPNWAPGSAHGYHARTFGFLIDELVRRIAGCSVAEYWRKMFADLLGLDLWIGLPAKEEARVASIYAPKAAKQPTPQSRQSDSDFYKDVITPGTFANKVFTSPQGLVAVSLMNKPEIRALPIASFGGIGSGHALAKFYAMLANRGELEDRQFFVAKTLSWMTKTLTNGIDRVFQIPTAFSAGFMKNSAAPENMTGLTGQVFGSRLFGRSKAAFGQPGAGGSHAFADPENRIAFAYVMNQMEQHVLPNEKSLRIIDAIYAAL
jgi:CubicO group peptidase (beta-lactamase class C family)